MSRAICEYDSLYSEDEHPNITYMPDCMIYHGSGNYIYCREIRVGVRYRVNETESRINLYNSDDELHPYSFIVRVIHKHTKVNAGW